MHTHATRATRVTSTKRHTHHARHTAHACLATHTSLHCIANQVDNIMSGQRKHKSGVYFDPNYPGFDVQKWAHVFSQEGVDVYLQGEEGQPPTRLRVFDRPFTPASVVEDARTMKDSGFDNRMGDPSKGSMSSGEETPPMRLGRV